MTDRFRDELQDAIAPNYGIEREITGGGMSRVYVATERALGRTVVIKVLRPDLAAGVNRERFRREIMLAAQLQHPHIVPLLNAGERGDLLWYTMPFVEGESLREALARRGKFSQRDATRVLHDVLDALAYAHRRGVIHRDIKPGNILTHGAHALVTDFGVAKALSAAMPHSGTTSVGIAIGTPAYMAPEQLAADPNADHRMDLYAVGLLGYELLTGEQPFGGLSPAATMAAQLTRMPALLEECCPGVQPQLASLVMRLLAKQPDDRPPTADAALAELESFATPQSGTSAPVSAVTPAAATPAFRAATPASGATPAPTPAGAGRRWMLIAAGVLVVVAGTALALARRRDGLASVAPVSGDSVRSVSVPAAAAPPPSAPTLTHDDSLRIAEAVRKRVDSVRRADAKRAGPDHDLDSLHRTLTRSSVDSAAQVKRRAVAKDSVKGRTTVAATRPAPAAAPRPAFARPRRVALLPVRDATAKPELAPVARAFEDSLRKTLTAAGYTFATDAELVRLMADGDMNVQRRNAAAAGIGAVITGIITARSNEVVAQAITLDVWRGMPSSQRDEGDLDKPEESLGVVSDVRRALERVSWRDKSDPHRVIIFDFDNQTGRDSLASVAREMTDSLRRAVARRSNVEVIADSTARVTTGVDQRRLVGEQRGAGALVAGTLYIRGRGDSLSIRLSTRDMSEDKNFTAIEVRVPAATPYALLMSLIDQLVAQIGQVNWGPRGMPQG